HTSSKRDWSSDVCSSDLGFLHQLEGLLLLDDRQRSAFVQLVELTADVGALAVRQRVEGRLIPVARKRPDPYAQTGRAIRACAERSEERRVGKECRFARAL